MSNNDNNNDILLESIKYIFNFDKFDFDKFDFDTSITIETINKLLYDLNKQINYLFNKNKIIISINKSDIYHYNYNNIDYFFFNNQNKVIDKITKDTYLHHSIKNKINKINNNSNIYDYGLLNIPINLELNKLNLCEIPPELLKYNQNQTKTIDDNIIELNKNINNSNYYSFSLPMIIHKNTSLYFIGCLSLRLLYNIKNLKNENNINDLIKKIPNINLSNNIKHSIDKEPFNRKLIIY